MFDLLVYRGHREIVKDCRKRLGRALSPEEKAFITSRGGCIALEMIHDTVKSREGEALEKYLNSEARTTST
jgi:hypothetical protein